MTISTTHVHTPWGQADSEAIYAEGVVFYGTPSHGGFKLDPMRNAEVHPALRERNGWYEEDCSAAKVVFSFPDLFLEADREQAIRTLKSWYPDAWEAITGAVLELGESHVKDERRFREAHAEDWVVIATSRSTAHPGMVECVATRAGERGPPGEPDPDERRYLVPVAEYDARERFGFVIDESRHARLDERTRNVLGLRAAAGSRGLSRSRAADADHLRSPRVRPNAAPA